MPGRLQTTLELGRFDSGRSASPSPACGEGQGGAYSTVPTRGKSPLPNPPPQAGEGKESGTVIYCLAAKTARCGVCGPSEPADHEGGTVMRALVSIALLSLLTLPAAAAEL